jgi:hypothetical protein
MTKLEQARAALDSCRNYHLRVPDGALLLLPGRLVVVNIEGAEIAVEVHTGQTREGRWRAPVVAVLALDTNEKYDAVTPDGEERRWCRGTPGTAAPRWFDETSDKQIRLQMQQRTETGRWRDTGACDYVDLYHHEWNRLVAIARHVQAVLDAEAEEAPAAGQPA